MSGPARAGGYPDYSSGGSYRFIPELWAGKLVEKFYLATVFGDIANTDYEGQIQNMGDNVVIRTRPSITVRNYTIGGGLTYEKPVSTAVSLPINKGKYFAFEINDVDAYQSDVKLMDEFTNDATEQMKIEIDADILGSVYADAASTNKGATAGAKSGDINLGVAGTPLVVTKATITDFIVDVGQVLDEQNIPETGRWMILPSWAVGLVKKSDLKDASLAGDGTSILRNGRIGMIDRFTIYLSNNLSVVSDTGSNVTHAIAGHKAGLTFASQMTKMEELPNPNDFGKLVRGLNVYGYKVVEGKYIADLYIKKG